LTTSNAWKTPARRRWCCIRCSRSSCARTGRAAHHLEQGTESFAEALTYFPEPDDFHLGPEEYLKHIAAAKKATRIPIIASLNGSSAGGWTEYAKQIQQGRRGRAGAEHLLHPDGLDLTGAKVEQTYLDILKAVKSEVTIPVAVKLSPFFSNFANMAKRLDEAGATAWCCSTGFTSRTSNWKRSR
jgi:dihydroorotate dehydrogenase (fumarate)